jgi:hypothetical protein
MIEGTTDPSKRQSYAGTIWTGILLSLSFVLLLILIVNSPPTLIVNSAPTDQTPSAPLRPGWMPWIVWAFTTRRSAFVYETLIAGMLGAYIGEISRLNDIKAGATSSEYSLHFRTALFLGGTAGIVVGVLLPLVVFNNFEGPGINSWTLVAAGGISGNLARGAFSRIETTIAKLLSNFESRFDSTKISESVRTGIHDAFAVPQPINYEGFVAIDVTRSNESVISQPEQYGDLARLQRGETFELRIQFGSERSIEGFSMQRVVKSISIRGCDDQPQTVQFRLFVDFGFVDVPPEERIMTVPRSGVSAIETFGFLVPVARQQNGLDKSVSPRERPQTEISVSIYQQAHFFESVVLPVTIEA